MANRHWVGASASWDGTAGSKWSDTSGGAGGASNPTSADDVFIDANSGNGTVTIATGNTGCKSLTLTGFTGTLAGSAAISVSGSITLDTTYTRTYTGAITINHTSGTATITSSGASFGASAVTHDGVGGTLVLTDDYNSTAGFTSRGGTFDTQNHNMTVGFFAALGTQTRSVTLGTSTITTSTTSGTPWNLIITGLTFSGASSTIILGGAGTAGRTFAAAGQTYHIVSFEGSDVANGWTVTGGLTADVIRLLNGPRNLLFTGGTTVTLTAASGWQVSGTFGNSNGINSTITGTPFTLSVASGTVIMDHVAIRSCTATGGATFIAKHFDNGGSFNTGWQFPPSGVSAARSFNGV